MAESTTVASYSRVQELATELNWDDATYRRALSLACLAPKPNEWIRRTSQFLVAIGTLLIVAGATAFFAWNWADLGHMLKFTLIQCGIVATILLAWHMGLDSIGGKASLFSSAFLVGVLLAVFGQVYQTGADPHGLFLGWAVLILPWVIIGRQAALWLLFQALLVLALIMYWTQVVEPPDGWWQLSQLLGPLVWLSSTLMNSTLASLVFALNVSALVAWEIAAGRGIGWVGGRAFPRIVAFAALSNVLIPTVILVFAASLEAGGSLGVVSPLLYLAFCAAGFYYYQYRRPDLLMLTMCVFSLVLVIMSLFIRYVAESSGGILLLAILLIGQVAGAAYWLRHVSRRWEGNS